jgi:glucose-6-phosphate 1-dehydrogenase
MSPVKLGVMRTEFQEKFCMENRAAPCGIVIFGASGDLAERKLFPALFNLRRAGLLPADFFVLGLGRTPMTDESFRGRVQNALKSHARGAAAQAGPLSQFLSAFHYMTIRYDEDESYRALSARLEELDKTRRTRGNRVFYLSLPPGLYVPVVQRLGAAGLARQSGEAQGWSRLAVEKPFGRDLSSAKTLTEEILKTFPEKHTYRIDHYLGKETVQSVLILRLANIMFEPIWNNRYVDHVEITAAETLGVEHRAGYYEEAGALRDMFQNHLLQLLCITAMEAPVNFEANRVRDEKSKVLRSIRPFDPARIPRLAVRGQYGPGDIDGHPVAGYRQEKGVAPGSNTETYAALKMFVDNWRWQGVPFYLRSGKRLGRRVTEIAVHFKRVPHLIFQPLRPEDLEPNVLVLHLQPEEGISLRFETKQPGPKLCMSSVTMNFNYETSFGQLPEAYERLFLDCLSGDQTLFNRCDWVELSWALLDPVLEHWRKNPAADFPNYAAGTWGPEAADELLAEQGHSWRNA